MQYRRVPRGCQSSPRGRASLWLLLGLGLLGAGLLWFAQEERAKEPAPSTAPAPTKDDGVRAPQPEPPPERGLRLRTLQRDASGNEKSLDGVKVSLYKTAAPGSVDERSISRTPIRGYLWNEGRTNLAGHLAIAHPGDGSFFWRAEKEGWSSVESPVFSMDAASADRRHEFSLILSVEATLALEVFAQGNPVKSATVLLLAPGRSPHPAQTDASGTARWKALAPGEYWVLVASSPEEQRRHFWPETAPALQAPSDFSLSAGETRSARISLEGNEPASISGGIRINGAAPQDAWHIHGTALDRPRQFPQFPMPPSFAKADSAGVYRILNLPPGRARVSLHAPPSSAKVVEREVMLTAGASTTVDFSIEMGALRGRIVDGKGKGFSQSRIVIRGTGEGGGNLSAHWTDEEGRFRTGPMLAGEYELTVHPAAGNSWTRQVQIGTNEVDLGAISSPYSSTDR